MSTVQQQPLPTVTDLRFEHRRAALGIGVARPRLSWRVETGAPGWKQTAYALEAWGADGAPLEATGRTEGEDSLLVAWPFAPLESRARRLVRVRVWGHDGLASAWSAPAAVEAGLLHPSDWQAHFVSPDWDEETSRPQPCLLLRRAFTLRDGIKAARLYVTALGLYEAEINGAPVSPDVMAPGWTSYHHRLRYQTYDVTALLRPGENALGATLADGWFRGRLGYGGGRRNIYGDRLALLAQLEVEYADGTREIIGTDETWRASTGPIRASDIYDGEVCDAREEIPGWSAPGFDDTTWAGVRRVEYDLNNLVAPSGPPVRRTQEVAPASIFQSPSGRTLVDFGQNLVGRIRLTVSGPAGHTITLRHAEVLENGELGTRPLRHAAATDTCTLRGEGVETYEPRFTFHGFRYAEVENWPGALSPDALRAVVIHSDLERRGWFECSDARVSRLHENVIWSMRGNFLDVPTDCPQRDERLGWTGDIQIFAPTATFLYDVSGFLQSWLADLAAEQAAAGGIVPYFVPNVMDPPLAPAAAWGDAATLVPWVLYARTGDVGILAAQYESARAWVESIARAANPDLLWEQGIQFGDWVDPASDPARPGDARTAPYVVATAYFARSAEVLAQMAARLGKEEDAAHYRTLAEDVRAAFARAYITPAGRVLSDATTAYALAIQFALLPTAEQRTGAGRRLAELVRGSGYHISTGFVGTPLVCDALCAAGETDAAYRLLLQETCPSWLYPLTMGATTIWERWDSMLPDGSINPGEMTSFNHYALGAVADWLHRTVAGLAPAAPGYKRLEIRPMPGGGLTFARARHITPYGPAESAWAIRDGQIQVEVEVPPNTSATVHLPWRAGEPPLEVGAGRHTWAAPYAAPARPLPALTLDSTLGEVIEHAQAYKAVMQVFAEHNLEFVYRLEGQLSVPLRDAARMNPRAEELEAKLVRALNSHS